MAKEINIIIAGDLLPSEKNIELFERGDSIALFGEEICKLFKNSDYSILNLEGSLTDSNKKQAKAGPVIKAPTKTINGIKVLGVKAVSLANNHATDYGNEGYADTVKTLDAAGIAHIGSGFTEEEVTHYKSIQIKDKKICIYCVSETFFNEPSATNAGAHLYDEYLVCNELADLKKTHDYIIVLYHGGAEYLQYPTPATRKRFLRMADSGADFITAQHTHCIGCIEEYNGTHLLHGQGNFLFARQKKYPNLTKEGLVAELKISETSLSVNYHHVSIVDNTRIIYDADYDFSGIYARSADVANVSLIEDIYKRLKFEELAQKYLTVMQGNHILNRIVKKYFPKYYRKYLIQRYSLKQMYFCWTPVKGERRKEDLYYLWKYLIEQKEQSGEVKA